jgi:hypothetical protein
MENESIKQRRMGIDQKGSQGQTQRAVVLQEEDVITYTVISHKALFSDSSYAGMV